MYGWRGRIGLMTPTGNSVMEPEFNRMCPEGVSVHANRVYLKDVTPDSLLGMEEEVEQSARGLEAVRLGVLAFGCTSGSFVGGRGYDEGLIARMEDVTGVPSTTTTTAVMRALREFGVSRVAMATPYTDEINAIEVKYLEDNDIQVTCAKGGGITNTADIQELEMPPPLAQLRLTVLLLRVSVPLEL